MKTVSIIATALVASISFAAENYPIVDTDQVHAYDDRGQIAFPKSGERYFGQDAQYGSNAPDYIDNRDGTVSDRVTGLMWTQDPGEKKTYKEAVSGAGACAVGGYSDWRLPSIKELYSLMQFNGIDPDPNSDSVAELKPFIDSTVFNFSYGDSDRGERIIDSQFATSTRYVSTTMGGNETMFGVNFADGRIKGYPITSRRGEGRYYVLYVRGNPEYGKNRFVDNGDGTITDQSTGLIWMKADSAVGMDWPKALRYAEDMEFAGHSDWRLPNAKELQSIVDYSRSPDTTDSAAIDPIFETTEIENEGGKKDFAHYWTSSTHIGSRGANAAVYFAFGRSLGFTRDRRTGAVELQDVHGAGSQRSDPKVGDASRFPQGRGPQGDVIRIENFVRLVRGGDVVAIEEGPEIELSEHADHLEVRSEKRSNRSGRGLIERADRNGDNRVSRNEFRGPDERFDRLDVNGDGFISEDEATSRAPRESSQR